ncbi:U2 snRNP complex subunit CUS1 NDAI_0K00810 [Naumovozyma dairenensis CBS 421]|uniref:PSP proline-rich domain-containing protein n=1 Tax=Naumovozyma dairenensis (strain ATCC 10597 / BCRC 20456 / CBS 421 / NBRC 0211 / NRRL Y-12639) TaxID=1071378 RepID=G0WHL1_NAUDC|nr:hypothetical protein NDAI_0K00810 [Naumovozyma dairenensis CBS 421]CCD27272.1 hypothetical protein NDAI_0K00810 [Naumovozyma dairenensis CBS 421]
MARKTRRTHHKKNTINGTATQDNDEKLKLLQLIDSRKQTSTIVTSNNKVKKHVKENSPISNISKEQLEKQFSSLLKKFEIPNNDNKTKSDITSSTKIASKQQKQQQQQLVAQSTSLQIGMQSKEPISKSKLRKIMKPSLSKLKTLTSHPELIQWYDCDAPYPYLLTSIKSSKNIIPVPSHWQLKREYLSGRSTLLTKKPFQLPDIIRQTDIESMRSTLPSTSLEDDDTTRLKQTMRQKVQPKLNSLDIDYKKLYDTFFKLGAHWKPPYMLPYGDLYYENRNMNDELEWSQIRKEKLPGVISAELRQIMNLQEGQLPPWYMKMQTNNNSNNSGAGSELELPPGYPGFKIAGINWDITNLKGETYGKLVTSKQKANDYKLFGQVVDFTDNLKEQDDEVHEREEEPEDNGEKQKVQNDILTPLGEVQIDKAAIKEIKTAPDVEKDETTTRQLYRVLKEDTANPGRFKL